MQVLLICVVSVGLRATLYADDSLQVVIAEAHRVDQFRTLDEWREVMKSLDPKSPEAEAEVSGLIELIQDESVPWFTRRQAAFTLGRIGVPAAKAVPILERYATAPIGDGETSTSLWAIKSLALFGPVAAPATSTLARLVGDSKSDPAVRMMSIEALCRIGSADPRALATVVELLRSHDPRVGADSVRSGPELDLVVACIESLELFRGDAESSVPILLRFSEDRADRVRRATAVTLGAIGPRARDAASQLAVMTVSDRSHDVRDVAAVALGRIGGTEWLVRILGHSDPAIRERAATGLGSVPGRDPLTKGALAAARMDESPMVRIAAIEATERWHSEPAITAPAAAQEMAASGRHVRLRAIRFLTKLGVKAAPALPILEQLRTHPDAQVRQAADKQIESIQGRTP